MGPQASTASRRTRQPLSTFRHTAASVVVSVVLVLSLCLANTADARMHYHRNHRRHHRHRQTTNNGHISQPPTATPPDGHGGDFPAEPPGFPPDVDDAPPPRSRRDKTCPPSRAPSKGPAFSPVGAPRSPAPARLPSSTPANSPSPLPAKAPSLSPTKATSPSHASPPLVYLPKPPTIRPAERPALPPAKPPVMSPARPPQLSPAEAPSSDRHAKTPSFSPAKLPAISPEQPPRLSPGKPPVSAPAKPPRLSPAKPPTALRPAIPPVAPYPPALPPANPPAAAPAAKNTSLARPSSNVFDVRAFGASGNGSCAADDTRAFRAAWKAACAAESSATLLVPSDGVFTVTSSVFAGPCKPGLTFQIDGVLMPPDGPASWPAADSRRQWIVFYKTDGITLTGKGTIEGNGEGWWNLPCKPHRGPNGSTMPGPCDSPALIRFAQSSNVTVDGLRIENSPQFHLKFDGCDRVRVDGLVVSSPAFSPNTDGVHLENSTSVQILNSRITNGDDCISIGGGCAGVHVENVTCARGHGISIGSLGARGGRACVSNVTVRGARVVDSDNGVRIKTWQGGAGSVSAVEFAGVQMDNVKNCIVIDQYYCLGSGCVNQTSAVRVAGVAYRGIRGTYNPRGGAPVRFACSDSVACTGITMTDVELRPVGGGGAASAAVAGAMMADPYCWNAYGVMETLTMPPVHCLQEGRPQSLQDQFTSC